MRPLQDLTNLDLQGNPLCSLPHYREFVIYQLRSLDVLDGQKVSREERRQADVRFAQGEALKICYIDLCAVLINNVLSPCIFKDTDGECKYNDIKQIIDYILPLSHSVIDTQYIEPS